MLNQTKWRVQASGHFWVRRDVGGTCWASFNLGQGGLRIRRSQSESVLDLIRLWRQWDVVVDLDRLADMDDYKRPDKPRLRLWPFSDGSYGGPSRSVDLSSMSC